MIYETIRWIFVVMSLIIIFIVTIGIMNVVSVNLFDRKREIGTYYCLGTEKGFLSRMYTWELLLVNLAASLTGILAGLLIREGINLLGLTTTEPGMQLVFGGSKFVMGISVSTIAWILASIPAVTDITSLMTLGKSLRVSPVSAIRETEE